MDNRENELQQIRQKLKALPLASHRRLEMDTPPAFPP